MCKPEVCTVAMTGMDLLTRGNRSADTPRNTANGKNDPKYLVQAGFLLDTYAAKERAQYLAAFVRQQARRQPRLMVQTHVLQQIHERAAASGLGIGRAVNHLIHAREDNRAGTHRTGLKGHVECRPFEPPTT